jgi:hypothetical protein
MPRTGALMCFFADVAAAWAAELTTTPGAFWINFRVWHADTLMQARMQFFFPDLLLFLLVKNGSMPLQG